MEKPKSSKTMWIIGGGFALLLIIIGLVVWYKKKGAAAPEEPVLGDAPDIPLGAAKDPREDLPPSTYLHTDKVPDKDVPTFQIPQNHPSVLAKKAQLASDYENQSSTNATIRGKYSIGETMFNGIISDIAVANIQDSIAKLFRGFQVGNLMQYPVYTEYNTQYRGLRAELAKVVEKGKNGVVWTQIAKNSKMDPSLADYGFLPSIQYNLFTGTNRKSEYSDTEKAYFMKANALASPDGSGMNVITLARNWIAEIDKMRAALEREAINKMLYEGWRIEGYTAPTEKEL